MANIFTKIWKGLNLRPESTDSTAALGDIQARSDLNKITAHNGTSASPLVTESHTATLTNKTLTGNTAANLVSGSGTLVLNTTGTATVPNATDTLVGKATTDTLTNKSIDGGTNTLSNISDTSLNTISTAGKVSNSATTATPANTASAIVARDGSGNFSAGTITASLTGNVTGDVTGNVSGTSSNVTSVVTPDHGGTGVANNAAATLTRSGNHAVTLTTTNTTSLTLPTAGTLATLAGTEVLTNKTLTGNTAANLISGSGTTTFNTTGTITLPNATDTLVGKATTDTLSNKTFGDAITSTQISTPSTPSAGFSKIYSKSDGFFYQLDPNGTERKIGTGAGGINYITNNDAEGSTTGWAKYADAAGNIPVDGTGGTATNLTFARSTSSPLVGTASFLMTQANSTNIQGNGVSYDFTIDSAFQAQVLAVSFNYNASSTFVASDGTTIPLTDGTTSTNAGNSDVEVFIYDVTNSALIPVNPFVITAKGSNNYPFYGTFQTAYNSTSYRLILHVATTSANATGWNFKFDNVVVGPQTTALGASMNDAVAYTPTYTGLGTVSNSNVNYWRAGDRLIVRGSVTAGTVSGTALSITLPSGLAIDYAKQAATATVPNGYLHRLVNTGTFASTNSGPFPIFADGSTTGSMFVCDLMTGTTFAKMNGNHVLSNNDGVAFWFEVPILGWSSGVQVSNGSDNRVVAIQYTGNAGTSLTANVTNVDFSTKVIDTHGAWSGSVFTAPVSGMYQVFGNIDTTTSGANWSIYVNGSQKYGAYTSVSSTIQGISATAYLIAGDTLSVRADANKTLSNSAVFHWISIMRVSGIPQIQMPAVPRSMVIYDSGSATAHGGTSSGDTKIRNFANQRVATGNDITYTTKTTTTADKFTVNTPGVYSITYCDKNSGGGNIIGITINDTATSTNISTPLTYAQGLRAIQAPSSTNAGCVSWTGFLNTNDVIRAHDDGGSNVTDSNCMITIVKVSN